MLWREWLPVPVCRNVDFVVWDIESNEFGPLLVVPPIENMGKKLWITMLLLINTMLFISVRSNNFCSSVINGNNGISLSVGTIEESNTTNWFSLSYCCERRLFQPYCVMEQATRLNSIDWFERLLVVRSVAIRCYCMMLVGVNNILFTCDVGRIMINFQKKSPNRRKKWSLEKKSEIRLLILKYGKKTITNTTDFCRWREKTRAKADSSTKYSY